MMAGGSMKKFRRNKIKEGMKNHKATKVLSDALLEMKEMDDDAWDEFAKKLADELGIEDVDKEELIKDMEDKVNDGD